MDLAAISKEAFDKAMAAEELWVAELKRVYGDKAYPDCRYDAAKNAATPELRNLYDTRKVYLRLWHAAGDVEFHETIELAS